MSSLGQLRHTRTKFHHHSRMQAMPIQAYMSVLSRFLCFKCPHIGSLAQISEDETSTVFDESQLPSPPLASQLTAGVRLNIVYLSPNVHDFLSTILRIQVN